MKLINHYKNPKIVLSVLLGLTIIIFILAILIQAGLGFYARYMTDDFCTTARLEDDGFWPVQAYWYNQWTGRFVFTFLVSVLELFGLGFPKFLPAIIVVLWVGSAFLLIRQVFKTLSVPLSKIIQVFLTLGLMYISLYTLPNTGQVLYWMTGSITYALPIILGLILFTLLIKFAARLEPLSKPQKILLFAAVFLLCVMVSGLSELTGVLLISILLAGLFYQRWLTPQKRFSWLWIFALVPTIITLLIVVSAPGNAIRQTYFADPPGITVILLDSAKYALSFALRFFVRNFHILFPLFLFTAAFTWFDAAQNKHAAALAGKQIKTITWFSSLCAILLFYACFLPSTYAMSQPPPDRVLVFPIFFTALSLIFLGTILGHFLNESIRIQHTTNEGLFLVSFAVLLFYFLANGPIYQARVRFSMRSNAKEFAQTWDKQHQQILADAAAGIKDIVVLPIEDNFMEVIYVNPKPTFWLNPCFADYYGVDSFRSEAAH